MGRNLNIPKETHRKDAQDPALGNKGRLEVGVSNIQQLDSSCEPSPFEILNLLQCKFVLNCEAEKQ